MFHQPFWESWFFRQPWFSGKWLKILRDNDSIGDTHPPPHFLLNHEIWEDGIFFHHPLQPGSYGDMIPMGFLWFKDGGMAFDQKAVCWDRSFGDVWNLSNQKRSSQRFSPEHFAVTVLRIFPPSTGCFRERRLQFWPAPGTKTPGTPGLRTVCRSAWFWVKNLSKNSELFLGFFLMFNFELHSDCSKTKKGEKGYHPFIW